MVAEYGLPVRPGIRELLGELMNREIPAAVASSSDRCEIDGFLKVSELHNCFAVIASGDEVTRSKPDPEIYLLAARRLGVDPRRCIAIEDTGRGVAAAAGAGMRVIMTPSGAAPDEGTARLAEVTTNVDGTVMRVLNGQDEKAP